MAVKESERLQTALGDGGYLRVAKHRFHDNIGQSPALQVLHDDPELTVTAHKETVDVVDQMIVPQSTHYLYIAYTANEAHLEMKQQNYIASSHFS